jgi:acyl-CoA synthetase (AMP-forming)/AMP-acid ligase II
MPDIHDHVTSIAALLADRAAATPDAPMLLDEQDREVTFGEARAQSDEVAARLQARGLGPGSRVSWQLPTRIETVITSLALSRLGTVQNPIIPIHRERELRHILTEHRPDAVIVQGASGPTPVADVVRGGIDPAPVLINVADLFANGAPGAPAVLPDLTALDPHQETWLYHTSGTTSAPKGVRHTDASLIAGARGMAATLEVRADDIGSIAFPYAHIGGPDYLGVLLLRGIPAVLMETFDVARAVELFNRKGVTLAGGTTAFYTAFLRAQRERPGRPILPGLRIFAGGGAPKPAEVFRAVQREMGVRIVHGWAMTECPMACCGTPSDTDEQLAETDGRPVPGCEVIVVRPDGSRADPGESGEIRVRGAMLFRGYSDPAINATSFDDEGYFLTGDLGLLRDDGRLVITGRSKDIIIRKGENISAREVEDLLYQMPGVVDVAVIGLTDAERGERVCAVVEAAADGPPVTLDAVRQHCTAAGLARYKTPEQVETIGALPRNATGKVRKDALRTMFEPARG